MPANKKGGKKELSWAEREAVAKAAKIKSKADAKAAKTAAARKVHGYTNQLRLFDQCDRQRRMLSGLHSYRQKTTFDKLRKTRFGCACCGSHLIDALIFLPQHPMVPTGCGGRRIGASTSWPSRWPLRAAT